MMFVFQRYRFCGCLYSMVFEDLKGLPILVFSGGVRVDYIISRKKKPS